MRAFRARVIALIPLILSAAASQVRRVALLVALAVAVNGLAVVGADRPEPDRSPTVMSLAAAQLRLAAGDADARAATRLGRCQAARMLHAGGPALKAAATGTLAGPDADLAAAGESSSAVYERLLRAFWSDNDTIQAYRDARWARQTAWRNQLQPYGVSDAAPEVDASIAHFIFGRQDIADQTLHGEPDYPKAGQQALDRISAIMAERPDDATLQIVGQVVLATGTADDARRFLLYGGYLAAAPAAGSVEFRAEVESLKIRWASCDAADPRPYSADPNSPLKNVVAAAAAEWDAELAAQAGPRNDIVTAEAEAAEQVRRVSETMVEAVGQAWVAEKILAVQKRWKDCPTCTPVPTAALKARATADLSAIKTTVAGLVTSAQQAVTAAERAAGKADAAMTLAAQIAARDKTPYGRGLAYAQQSAQVTKASAAASAAAAKATETALRAVQATAADSAALLALAQTQSLALRAEFKRVAAQQAAAQARAAAVTADAQAAEAGQAAARAAADRATAEQAEATARTAGQTAHDKRVVAERERDIAAEQRATAEAERAKAQRAEAQAQAQQQAAAEARGRAQAAGDTASQRKDAALAAERAAGQARDDAVRAERNRDALRAKAAALRSAAAAAEGEDGAAQARTAADEAQAAAAAATGAATAARAAANEATEAAVAAREAATRATAAAERARAAADGAWADATVSQSAAAAAHAAAADAIVASEQAARNAAAAEQQAKLASNAAAEARADAADARKLAEAAQAESARTAGYAYAAAAAAAAAGDAARAVTDPANKAITLGTPFWEKDASAGLAVLVGQSAKTLAAQHAAAAEAKAAEADRAAEAARQAAARADADAKAAAQAAAEAATDAAAAAESLERARQFAAAATRDATAAQQADARAATHAQQALGDALQAEWAANSAESDATAARNAATAAERDAASARGAAGQAESDAAAARNVAAQAARDATTAEQAAANARASAQEAQEAAQRAEAAAKAQQDAAAIGPNAPSGMENVIVEPMNVNDELPREVTCQPIDVSHCQATITHHLTGQLVFYVRTCPDPNTTNCPGRYVDDYLGTEPLDKHVTRTYIFNTAQIVTAFWLTVAKAMVQDYIDCYHGKYDKCALAAGEFALDLATAKAGTLLIGLRRAVKAKALETAADGAIFWSGTIDGESVQAIAQGLAELRGGTTLESLLASERIPMPTFGQRDAASVWTWEEASRKFAMGARGEIRAVVGDTVKPNGVWQRVELPALKDNPNVTKIIEVDARTGRETVIFTR